MPSVNLFNQSIVVFSQNYLPITRVTMQRAITLLVTGKAQTLDLFEEKTSWEIRSPSVILQVTPHIRLTVHSGDRIWKVPPVSRQEVLRRDKHQCQYCGSRRNLTLDHVIPRSKGGKHSWDNVVTACASCNGRKGDLTPQSAGMSLKTVPKAPMHPAIAFAEEFWQSHAP
ncbi:MAG: HNH endonuclease [Cyanobacteria bacterium P01_G01_bin.49]